MSMKYQDQESKLDHFIVPLYHISFRFQSNFSMIQRYHFRSFYFHDERM
jgi:hypothetical protein